MIAMYDLEDNLITIFDSYKECAKNVLKTIEELGLVEKVED